MKILIQALQSLSSILYSIDSYFSIFEKYRRSERYRKGISVIVVRSHEPHKTSRIEVKLEKYVEFEDAKKLLQKFRQTSQFDFERPIKFYKRELAVCLLSLLKNPSYCVTPRSLASYIEDIIIPNLESLKYFSKFKQKEKERGVKMVCCEMGEIFIKRLQTEGYEHCKDMKELEEAIKSKKRVVVEGSLGRSFLRFTHDILLLYDPKSQFWCIVSMISPNPELDSKIFTKEEIKRILEEKIYSLIFPLFVIVTD